MALASFWPIIPGYRQGNWITGPAPPCADPNTFRSHARDMPWAISPGSGMSLARHGHNNSRLTPRSVFKEGLRFLTKTGDSTFAPVTFSAYFATKMNRLAREDALLFVSILSGQMETEKPGEAALRCHSGQWRSQTGMGSFNRPHQFFPERGQPANRSGSRHLLPALGPLALLTGRRCRCWWKRGCS